MNLRQRIRSLLLRAMFGQRVLRWRRNVREARRRLFGRPHVISVFLQIDDPYSYLLSCFLPQLGAHYDIDLRLHLSQARGGAFQPAPELLAEYAVADCARLAAELGVPFLDIGPSPPTEHRTALADAVATLAGSNEFDSELLLVLAIYWRGDSEAASRRRIASGVADCGLKITVKSQALQRRLGHYDSATLHYEGEWYRGIDRLHYLMQRLDVLGVARSATPDPALPAILQVTQIALPVKPPSLARKLPPLDFFHSVRSPYSYLALQRVCTIADAFGVELILRPVLPMVMRGYKVPRAKLLYIAEDVAREAHRLGIPFGKLADPLGAGIPRALAVYHYAETQNRARDFLLNLGLAIWSEAIDISTDSGMRKVTARSGLFWPEAKAAMQAEAWRNSIAANGEALLQSGSWGVPTLQMGNFVVWGQDRDWMLVRHIEELCDSGEGILV